MRDLSCDIRFPYNWNREFYCGERLQLSVELRCAKVVVLKGVELSVSCRNDTNEPADEYGRYIKDPEEVEDDCKETVKTVSDFKADIDLLGNYDRPIRLQQGTHIFNLNCWLPERISDQSCDTEEEYLSLTVSVRVRKTAKNEEHSPKEMSHSDGWRQTSFTWPGTYGHIRNYSQVQVDICSYHVSNTEDANNRYDYEESEDSFLENWLGCIPMQGELLEEEEECSAIDD
ncbi:uncharacterized protein LOC109400182 [Aedes albopictus]|uniref:Secreted protein n=1 Tax=Aedes albopictus TaxID=7160 RepID=A0ABM1XNE5_AEDAL|nr:uncharacterized protein LOC109400182 [Aedes albopictus]